MKILTIINLNSSTSQDAFEFGQKFGKKANWKYTSSFLTFDGFIFDGVIIYTGKYDEAKAFEAVKATIEKGDL